MFQHPRVVDTVRARYRSDEGLNCDGTRAPPPTSPGA